MMYRPFSLRFPAIHTTAVYCVCLFEINKKKTPQTTFPILNPPIPISTSSHIWLQSLFHYTQSLFHTCTPTSTLQLTPHSLLHSLSPPTAYRPAPDFPKQLKIHFDFYRHRACASRVNIARSPKSICRQRRRHDSHAAGR